jgi:hypothetical protein
LYARVLVGNRDDPIIKWHRNGTRPCREGVRDVPNHRDKCARTGCGQSRTTAVPGGPIPFSRLQVGPMPPM